MAVTVPERVPTSYIAALIPVATAINVVGGWLVNVFHLPVFIDMIGTAVVAFTISPWWAVVCGILTNVVIAILINPVYLPFAACNAVGGLYWGYLAKYGFAKDFPRLLFLGITSAFVITSVAVPIYVFVFGGATGHFSDIMTAAFLQAGLALPAAVFSSNIIVSLADKVLSVFVAVAIIEALPPALKYRVEIMRAPPARIAVYVASGIAISMAFLLIAKFIFHLW